MSLRIRLTILVAIVFIAFWLIVSIWMVAGLNNKLENSFDKRLESTAMMLSNILRHVPHDSLKAGVPNIITENEIGTEKGLTCQISSLHGAILTTSNSGPFSNNNAFSAGFDYLTSNKARWRTFTLITKQRKITIADKVSERQSLYYDLLKSILIPPTLAIFITLALLWFAIGKGIQPIMQLTTALKKRGSNDLAPIELTQPSKELQPLLDSQNALMARLEQTIKREKQFTSNAAHELRTPLAGILSQTQIAHLSTGDKQLHALEQVELSCKKLTAILDNLLLLANIDAAPLMRSKESYSIEALLKSIIQELAPNEERVAYMIQGDEYTSALPPMLLAIVGKNLLDNALKYSKKNTPIIIISEVTDEHISLRVRNEATLPAADVPLMTTRFWRKRNAQGAGLGLSIVDTIAQSYHGSIKLQQQDEIFTAEFTIPAA